MRKTILVAILSAAIAFVFAACDWVEDEVEDAVDADFEEDAEIDLSLTITEQSDDPQPEGLECGTTSINAELERAGIDVGDIDISGVELEYVRARYAEADWTPTDATVQDCVFALFTDGGSAVIVESDPVRGGTSWTDINVSDDAVDAINYVLSHRSSEFSYCASCDEDADTYTVKYEVEVGVTVSGEISG